MEKCKFFRIIDVHLSDQSVADLSLLSSGSPFLVREEEEKAFVGSHGASELQMSDLGLPTSFSSTSRRMGNRRPRRRKRVSRHQFPLQMSPIDSVKVSMEGTLDDDGARDSNNEANHCSLTDPNPVERASVLIGDNTNHATLQRNEEASFLSCGVTDATSAIGMLALDGTVQTDESMVTTMLNIREPLGSERSTRLSDGRGLIGSMEEMVLNGGDVAPEEQALVSVGREMATKDSSNVEALLRDQVDASAVSVGREMAAKDSSNVEATLRDQVDASGVSIAEDEETIPLNGSNHGAVDTGAMAESVSCKGTDERVNNVFVEEVAESLVPEIFVDDSQFPSPDWLAYWDDYYGRYYFFNTQTLETTWEPPAGYESYAYIPAVEYSNEALQDSVLNAISNSEEHKEGEVLSEDGSKSDGLLPLVCQEITTMASESGVVHVEVATCKASVPTRREKKVASLLVRLENQHTGMAAAMVDHSPSIIKYWVQRFSLFSKYDLGVKLDEEGWFSVTPEAIAKHQSTRCRSGVIVDAFTGVGGNAIQFALAGHYVIAIDNDPKKIECARHNATVYGVAASIDFVLGDFFAVSSSMQAEVVFLSPPWGGPDYLDCKVYDILTMLQPKDALSMFKVARAVAPNIMFFLPRNVDMNQLAELSNTTLSPCCCEVERNFLNGKLKAVTAYYGQFVRTEEACG